jgi:hypothetical protein
MAKLRTPDQDKHKNFRLLTAQLRTTPVCKLEDCCNPLSDYEGPGSDSLCREHQLEQVEYGGMGKASRPHTFYRAWVCTKCKYDARLDPEILEIEDPWDQLVVMRGVMHGDHLIRKSDGGKDTKENINALCCRCHMIKTYKEKDYLKGNKNKSTETR